MTISITASHCTYTGDGSTVTFDVKNGANGIYFAASSELAVTLRSGDTITNQTLGTHYTVSGAGSSAGTITFLAAPANGVEVRIERNTPLTNTLNLGSSSSFDPDAVEGQFDKVARALQDLSRKAAGGSGTWDSLPLTLDASGDEWDGQGKPLGGLAVATDSDQAVVLGQVEDAIEDAIAAATTTANAAAAAAAGSATTAAASASTAATHASAAGTARTAAETARTAAETASGTATTQATAASASAASAAANSSSPSFTFRWSTNTAASDPGATYVKGNNASLGSITTLYLSETSLEGAISGFLTAMFSGTGSIRAQLTLIKPTAKTNFVTCSITGHVGSGAFRTLTATVDSANGSFLADDLLVCLIVPERLTSSVSSVNSRTGAVTIQASDVSAFTVASLNGRTGAVTLGASDLNHRLASAHGLLSGEEGIALDFLTRSALINDYADVLSNVGRPQDILSVTRASTKLVTGRNRLLGSVAANALGYDHDPVTGQPRGVLIEPAATNLLVWSEQLDNAAWSKIACTITANAIAAPDGATTADKIVESTALAERPAIGSATVAANTRHTFSVFVKAAERSAVMMVLCNPALTDGFRCFFNLATGAVAASSIIGAGTFSEARIEAFPNGWYRCSISGVIDSSTTSARACIFVANSPSTTHYTGDGSSGLHAWGAQLEAGPVPTSYIQTTSATVARSADVVSLTASLLPISPAQGTLFVEGSSRGGAAPMLASLNAGSHTDQVSLFLSGGSVPVADIFVGGSALASISGTSVTPGVTTRLAVSYAADDAAFAKDGVLAGTDGSLTIPTVTSLNIGHRAGGLQTNGHIRRVMWTTRRMTNAEIQALTI